MNHNLFNEKNDKIKKLEQLKTMLDKNKEIIDLSDIIRHIVNDIDSLKKNEIRLVILGTFGAGKTSLLKGLLGIDFLPTKSGENSSTIVYFKSFDDENKNENSIIKINIEGLREIKLNNEQTKEDLILFLEKQAGFEGGEDIETDNRYLKLNKYLNENELKYIRKNGWDPARDVYTATVFLDNDILNNGIIIVDTPGVGSITEKHEEITVNEIKRSNAFIYLFDANQFGTESEFNFLRRIWDYRNKSILIFNKSDILMTDKANSKDVEVVVNEFISKIPAEFNREELPRIVPLSTLLKFGSESEIRAIMSDLNNNYKSKDKTSEDLSNWNGFLSALNSVIFKLKKDDTLDIYEKIDVSKYKEAIINRLDESLANLKDIADNNIEHKIKKYSNSIAELEKSKDRIIKHDIRIDDRVECLKKDIREKCNEIIKKIEGIFTNEIDNLSYEELFEEKKHEKPLSIIKTEADRLKDKIAIMIKNDIFEYVRDIADPKNKDNSIQLGDYPSLEIEPEIILVSSLNDELKVYDNRIRDLEYELEQASEDLTEITKHFNQYGIINEYNKNEIEELKQRIDSLQKVKLSLENQPAPQSKKEIMKEKIKEYKIFNKKIFEKKDYEKEVIDNSEYKEYRERINNIEQQLNNYTIIIKEFRDEKLKIEIIMVDLECQYKKLENDIVKIKEKIAEFGRLMDIEKDKKKNKELKNTIYLIYNKTIMPVKDWCDNLNNKLKDMYTDSIELARGKIIIHIENEITKMIREYMYLQEIVNKNKEQKEKNISEINNLKTELRLMNI